MDLHRLVEALGRLVGCDAEPGELAVAIALADAEIEPAVRQQVERRRLLGDEHRVVPGQHDDRRPQPDALRAGGKIAEHVQRGGDLADAGEMMLDHEDAMEAELLGLADIGDVVAVALAVAGGPAPRGAGTAEQSEQHRVIS
jgi:hypothetical protein